MEAKVVCASLFDIQRYQFIPEANSNYLEIAHQLAVAWNEVIAQRFPMILQTILFRAFSLTLPQKLVSSPT